RCLSFVDAPLQSATDLEARLTELQGQLPIYPAKPADVVSQLQVTTTWQRSNYHGSTTRCGRHLEGGLDEFPVAASEDRGSAGVRVSIVDSPPKQRVLLS